MYCPACGNGNPDGVVWCIWCKEKLPEQEQGVTEFVFPRSDGDARTQRERDLDERERLLQERERALREAELSARERILRERESAVRARERRSRWEEDEEDEEE